MKNKKRTFAVILITAITALLTFVLSACTENAAVGVNLVESSEKTVVIEATKTGGSLEDGLKQLKSEGLIDYDGTNGEFGLYLGSVNGYSPDASKNEYFAIYTNLGDYEGVSYSNSEFGTFEYGGTTYASASYGATGLPLIEGKIYIITIATY